MCSEMIRTKGFHSQIYCMTSNIGEKWHFLQVWCDISGMLWRTWRLISWETWPFLTEQKFNQEPSLSRPGKSKTPGTFHGERALRYCGSTYIKGSVVLVFLENLGRFVLKRFLLLVVVQFIHPVCFHFDRIWWN